MTEQQQRIAIAKACGWDFDPPIAREWKSRGKFVNGPGGVPGMVFAHRIPDYINDLNAMHDAVMKLDRKTLAYSNYCSHLQQIVAIQNSKSNEPGIQAIDATAAQRAEAFLRTLNLWKL